MHPFFLMMGVVEVGQNAIRALYKVRTCDGVYAGGLIRRTSVGALCSLRAESFKLFGITDSKVASYEGGAFVTIILFVLLLLFFCCIFLRF
jgi:hypothetical protein